ncbi:hypothetical protein Tco_0696588 [Tanacetum coccineum]
MRIETIVPQKEETFQVFLDIIKASPCFKAFTITADFSLADKKFLLDDELFRKILDICLRFLNEDFVAPESEEDLLTFLIELGYKVPLDHLSRMFVDHMHQPWRTLATIINKCLSGKTSSNDRLRLSRVAILCGMFYWENVDYPIFTKIIINHFLSLKLSIPKGASSDLHTIKDDGVISRLKFFRIGEDFQEYGRAIPDMMLTKDIKHIKAYQTFIKYSTGLIHSKKSRCKGSQRKKTVVTPKPASVEVYDESDPEPTNRPTSRRNHLLKGIQTLTAEEHLAADTMQAIKAIKMVSRSQPHARGSSEGTSVSPRVLDESTVIFTTSSEGTENEIDYFEEDKVDEEIKWLTTDEEEEKQVDQDDDDDRSINIEEIDDDEKIDDEFVHSDEYVHNDVDEEMKDAEVVVTRKDDDEGSDAAKVKTEEVKGDNKKADLPPTSSSLFVSSGFVWEMHFKRHSRNILNNLDNSQKEASELHEDPSARLNHGKRSKRRRTKESKSSKNSSTSKGTTPPKTSKSDKLVHAKESVVVPTDEVIRDAANDNVVNDANQPQDDSEPKTYTTPRNNCFTQPPRPPTLDPEWKACIRNKTVRTRRKHQIPSRYGSSGNDPPLNVEGTRSLIVLISAADNIIPEQNVALELGKSTSLAAAEEEEAGRHVHATNERLMMESDPEPARRSTRRRPSGIAFRDTSSVSKKKSPDQSQKLKGIQTLTAKEQLAADMMQALKASKKISRSQPHARGLSEGTGVSPGVPDESTLVLITLKEESKYYEEENVEEEIKLLTTNEDEEKKDDDEDNRSIDIEQTDDDEETADEFVHGDEYVHDNVNEEIKDAEVAKTGKDDEEITNAEKTDAEKTKVTKGDLEQTGKLPLTSSSLSVSSGFGNQFLNFSSNTSLIGTTKESADTKINSLLDIQIQQEPTVLSSKPEIPIVISATTLTPHPSVTNLTPVLQQQTKPIPTPPITTVAPAATTVLDLLPAIIVKSSLNWKRTQRAQTTSKETSKGDTPPKSSKTGKSKFVEESVKEATYEVIMGKEEPVQENVNDADQLDGEAAPKNNWFKQPPRTPTSDPEWNKGKEIFDGQDQTWFNDLLSAKKDPLTFDELMATPIDFSKFVMNRLKIDKLTKVRLVGPVYNLLKGTCQSSIELEYNIEECYKALSNQLDWNNPEGDRCPFDLSKPLPLKGCPGHLTVALEYFFNNDLKYLKSLDPKKKYTMSITKTKAARYELVGIEDMIPMKCYQSRL